MIRPVLMTLSLCAACTSSQPPDTSLPRPIVYPSPPPVLVTAPNTKSLEPFVSEASRVVVLQHVHVIDGTGRPGKDDQVIVISDGRITAVGAAAGIQIPSGAKVLDLTGRTVFPGLVDMHGHLFYGQLTRPPIADVTFAEQAVSFPRLYLAAGVTTARTTGSLEPYADLAIKRRIDRGELAGPHLALTAPYLTGPGEPIMQMAQLGEADQVNRFVTFWLDAGFTSLKAYMHLTRAQLAAAIKAAHARGVKITGHLCAVTFTEAADLGIDNLEHGLETALQRADTRSGREPSAGRGRGSTFRVTLPLAVSTVGRQRISEASAPLARPSLDGLRVLLVDDEADARILLTEILERRGAIVQTVGSAAEALAVIAAAPPDVLVSDIGMPGEDGYSLIRKVRSLASGSSKTLPAVALTAFARVEDRSRALLAGFQSHIVKPVDATELVIVVAALAGRMS